MRVSGKWWLIPAARSSDSSSRFVSCSADRSIFGAAGIRAKSTPRCLPHSWMKEFSNGSRDRADPIAGRVNFFAAVSRAGTFYLRRTFYGEGILDGTAGLNRAGCRLDHVDESAQSSRNLPVTRIIQKESPEGWRPVLQDADQLS
jgi:hypothetical protein